ncbi:MAG: endolytic transglycosylase MltG [Rhodothermales bacterium]|nr:endolytic transglycosylase MltG [Rhodothermales bacterium]MBO6780372.1 endolytic transglycosylase MltG [Rhodothermales bacterium]
MRSTLLKVFIGFLVLGATAVGVVSWMAFAPNTPAYDDARSVKLPAGSSLETVQDSLVAAGILDRRWTFDFIARASGWGDQIKSGHYEFQQGQSNIDLLSTLRAGLETPVRVTIIEGTRRDFMARRVARSMAFTEHEFLTALSDQEFAESLGTDTLHLFSYMLPDTYFFYWESSPQTVIREIKETFDRFYDQAADGAPGLPGLTLDKEEVMSMAAIVEWESGLVEEKATIAGVYMNRLRDRWPLQADPTIQYALIELEGSKRRLFNRDYRIDHPYNTYQYRGLPPGPVTNPSRSSIEGVLRPESHGYYFFVARGDGGHIFSRTLGEHRRNAQAFFRLMRERRAAAAAAEEAEGSN